jgi:hypothetical protein
MEYMYILSLILLEKLLKYQTRIALIYETLFLKLKRIFIDFSNNLNLGLKNKKQYGLLT